MKNGNEKSRAAHAAPSWVARGGLLALALVVTSSGATGCKRWRERLRRHGAASRAAAAQPRARVPPPARRAAVDPACVGARETAEATSAVSAGGPVDQIAVGASPRGAVVLASVEGLMRAGPAGGPALARVGAGTPGTDRESDPALAASGDGFVAAWRRTRGEAGYIVFARLSPAGALVGEERAEQLDQPREGAAVASAGPASSAVAYVTAGAVTVRIVREDGSMGAPVLLPGSTGASSPALAWAGGAYLVAWASAGANARGGRITVAEVQPATGEVHPLSAVPTRSASPRVAIASGGGNFALAWQEPAAEEESAAAGDAGAADQGAGVYTAWFQGTGVRLNAPRRHGGAGAWAAPAMAWGDDAFALAWSEREGAGGRARWSRLAGAEAEQEEALEVRGAASPAAPRAPASLAWDGSAWVLAREGADPAQIAVHRFGPRGCDAR